jgi:hypothetical protein
MVYILTKYHNSRGGLLFSAAATKLVSQMHFIHRNVCEFLSSSGLQVASAETGYDIVPGG